jgi:iron complex outermembrane recepter protein
MRSQIVLFAGVSVLSLATPAFGQAEPPQATPAAADIQDDTGELAPGNEIIVSARRREESVQDVPQTVNVVTSAQIDKLNLRTFTDIAAVVPGLTLSPGGSFGSNATLRGVSFSPIASGNNPTVEFYVNDGPASSNLVFQSLFDVGQFEVQRGPQGTLRGRASPSGSILFNTRRPDLDEPGLVANGTVTDIEAYKFDAALNLPIVSDVLAVRLAGVIDQSQGDRVFTIKQQTQPQFNPDPSRETQAIRASVLFEPTDFLTAHVMYQKLKTRSNTYGQVQSLCLVTGAACPATSLTIRPFDRLSISDQGGGFVQDHTVLVGNVDLRFAGQRLSYVGSYNKQDFNAIGSGDAGDFFAPPNRPVVLREFVDAAGADPVCQREGARAQIIATTGNFYQCTQTVASRHSHEIRLASEERIAGMFDYVVGALFDKSPAGGKLVLTQETPILIPAAFAPRFGGLIINATPIVSTGGGSLERSVFGNLTAHVTDQLELSGGVRFIDYQADRRVLRVGTTDNPSNPVDEKATVYMGSIKYEITPDIMVYGTVGSSYRPGARVIGNFSIGATGQGLTARERSFADLPAEKSTSYEIGAKTSFFGGRGRFNISLYRQDFDNFVFRGPGVFYRSFSTSAPGGQVDQLTSYAAAVPVRVEGGELEASYQILERWSLGVNASYSDGRIQNGTIPCTDLDRNGIPDASAARPTLAELSAVLPAGENVAVCSGYNGPSSFSPKFSANVQSEIGFDLSERIGGFARGLFNFLGRTEGDPFNGFDTVDEFGILNLYAGLRDVDGAWEVSLFGKNILKQEKVLSTTNNPLTTTVIGSAGIPTTTFTSTYVPVEITPPREFGITARIAIGSR